MQQVNDLDFSYRAVLKSDGSGRVTSLIAYQVLDDRPLRAVIWDAQHREWVSAPELAAPLLYDERNGDRVQIIDRAEAETIARQSLSTELPDTEALAAISDEGERMSWDFGPPRQ